MAKRGRYSQYTAPANQQQSEFLKSAYSAEDGVPWLVVVSNLDHKYTEPGQPPVDSFPTSFVGESLRECSKLIQGLTTRTKSNLNYEYLVILDERSLEGETALMVVSSDLDEEPLEFRAQFKIVDLLMGAMVSKGLAGEYKEVADGTSHGVLGF